MIASGSLSQVSSWNACSAGFAVRFAGSGCSPDFRKLWTSLTITAFGAQITNLALPLTAALLLHATPLQMGVLIALETLPFALVSLHAGRAARPRAQAADRHRLRPRARHGAARHSRCRVHRHAGDGDPVRRRLLLRRVERGRRRRVPGAARATGGAQAAGRGQRQDRAGRDVVGADRSRPGRRPHPAADRAVRDHPRRADVLRVGVDAAAHTRAAGRAARGPQGVGHRRDRRRAEARLAQPHAAVARLGRSAVAVAASHAARRADPVRDARTGPLGGRDRPHLRVRRLRLHAGGGIGGKAVGALRRRDR